MDELNYKEAYIFLFSTVCNTIDDADGKSVEEIKQELIGATSIVEAIAVKSEE